MTAVSQDIESKATLLIRITCAAWLAAKAITWKLWLSVRFFPVIPVSEYFPAAAPEIHLLLFILSLAGILLLLLFPQKKPVIGGFIFVELLSCLLDQMRWQPWEYQYLLTLVFLWCSKDRKQFLSLMAVLVAGTYFFSGLHKFCGAFLYNIWEKLILRHLFGLNGITVKNPILHYSGLILPAIEIVLGFGLMFSKNRKYCAILTVAVHLLILAALIGINQNIVVWPWNMALASMVFILFWDSNGNDIGNGFIKSKLNTAVLIFAVLLPLAGVFGYWDNYLSFNLYSGNVKELYICSNHPKLRQYRIKRKKHFCTDATVSTNKWALGELNVPVYPEERTFHALKREWDKRYPYDNATFYVIGYPYKKENLEEIK